MKILFAHLKLRLKQLAREPGYVASTMVFPALFFLLFALPNADTPEKARFLMASFTAFALLGVGLFQFGVHQAQELKSGWYSLQCTLPVRAGTLLFAQAVNAVICGIASALVVFAAVEWSAGADMPGGRWLLMTATALALTVPFAVFAAAVAEWTGAAAALPVFNLIYILSSFAGGLWMPPAALPQKVEKLSQALPTRHLGEILWKLSLGEKPEAKFFAYLGIFLICATVALVARGAFTANAPRSSREGKRAFL